MTSDAERVGNHSWPSLFRTERRRRRRRERSGQQERRQRDVKRDR